MGQPICKQKCVQGSVCLFGRVGLYYHSGEVSDVNSRHGIGRRNTCKHAPQLLKTSSSSATAATDIACFHLYRPKFHLYSALFHSLPSTPLSWLCDGHPIQLLAIHHVRSGIYNKAAARQHIAIAPSQHVWHHHSAMFAIRLYKERPSIVILPAVGRNAIHLQYGIMSNFVQRRITLTHVHIHQVVFAK